MNEETKRAYDKVVRSVNVCETSTVRMRKKLTQAGFPEGVIEDVLGRACKDGLIDDRRYSDLLVRSTLLQGKGLSLVLKEIEQLGIDPASLESYDDYCATANRDSEIDRAFDYLCSHRSYARDVYGGSLRKLIGRGYDFDVASAAARRYCDEENNSDCE